MVTDEFEPGEWRTKYSLPFEPGHSVNVVCWVSQCNPLVVSSVISPSLCPTTLLPR